MSEDGRIFITLDDNEIHALRYVLDSFAGSGTTGHAVLKMNVAGRSGILPADGGENGQDARATGGRQDACPTARRFILVEVDEKIAPDITRERVKRVA